MLALHHNRDSPKDHLLLTSTAQRDPLSGLDSLKYHKSCSTGPHDHATIRGNRPIRRGNITKVEVSYLALRHSYLLAAKLTHFMVLVRGNSTFFCSFSMPSNQKKARTNDAVDWAISDHNPMVLSTSRTLKALDYSYFYATLAFSSFFLSSNILLKIIN
jgi:hypothetical protein